MEICLSWNDGKKRYACPQSELFNPADDFMKRHGLKRVSRHFYRLQISDRERAVTACVDSKSGGFLVQKVGAVLPRQSSVDSRDSARAAPMEVDDDAMFQQRDKKPKPSLQDSVSQMKKVGSPASQPTETCAQHPAEAGRRRHRGQL